MVIETIGAIIVGIIVIAMLIRISDHDNRLYDLESENKKLKEKIKQLEIETAGLEKFNDGHYY